MASHSDIISISAFIFDNQSGRFLFTFFICITCVLWPAFASENCVAWSILHVFTLWLCDRLCLWWLGKFFIFLFFVQVWLIQFFSNVLNNFSFSYNSPGDHFVAFCIVHIFCWSSFVLVALSECFFLSL